MNRPQEDNEMTRALREGLRAQPVPQAGPDFDERVLSALRTPRSWWQSLWLSLRPVISTAACSMVAMLAISHWILQPPQASSPTHPSREISASTAQANITMAMLDKALDRPDLRFGTFALLFERRKPQAAVSPSQHPPGDYPARPPDPPRKDGSALHRDITLA